MGRCEFGRKHHEHNMPTCNHQGWLVRSQLETSVTPDGSGKWKKSRWFARCMQLHPWHGLPELRIEHHENEREIGFIGNNDDRDYIVFHHAHINDERDSPAAESAARSQNNYQNKSKEQERIILVHIAISMATWMIAMLSWAGQLALTTDSYPVAEWFDSIAHDETAMIIGQIDVRIAFKCPHSPTGRDNGLRNHPVRVRIPVKAQFPPLCVMLGGMSNHMPVTWEQYCSHEHMWLQKYSTRPVWLRGTGLFASLAQRKSNGFLIHVSGYRNSYGAQW